MVLLIIVLLHDEFHLAPGGVRWARLAVSKVHDVHSGLMPPVKHSHHKYVPHLVAGAQVVQLARKISLRDFGDVEQEGRTSNQVHYYNSRQKQLHNIGGETTIEPDPVAGRNRANTCHATEDRHPYPTPVIAEVTRVDLSAEDGQDQGQHCQQVDLPPKSVTIESVEDPRYIAAQDANRNACIVQRQPAAASLLRSMTREEVIPH